MIVQKPNRGAALGRSQDVPDLNAVHRSDRPSGLVYAGGDLYTGKTLFAQVMDFLPWKIFHRIVDRHQGDHRVCTLSRSPLPRKPR